MAGPSDIIRLARTYNQAAPGANTDIFATPISIPAGVNALRITVVLGTTSVFNYTTTDGTTLFTVGLNQSVALESGDAYSFVIDADSGLTYNFRVETDGVIRGLLVYGIKSAVV